MDGIGAAIERIKRIFYRRFSYRYNPSKRTGSVKEFLKTNNKPIFIVFLAAVLIGSMYMVTNSITGYVAHTTNIEEELIDTKDQLETMTAEEPLGSLQVST